MPPPAPRRARPVAIAAEGLGRLDAPVVGRVDGYRHPRAYLPTSQLDHAMTMAFGDVFELDGVKSFALAELCERRAIPRGFFASELATLSTIALKHAPPQAIDPMWQGKIGEPWQCWPILSSVAPVR